MTNEFVTETVTQALSVALAEHLHGQLEYEMKQAGVDAYLALLHEAHGQNESQVPYGQRLLRSTLRKAAAEIDKRLDEIGTKGRPGVRAAAWHRLKDMDRDITAYLTGKAVLDGCSSEHPLNKVAVKLGGMIEDEQRLARFAEANKGAFKWTMERVKHSTSRHHKRATSIRLMDLKDIPWTSWPHSERLLVGTWLIDAFVHATGLFDCQLVHHGAGSGSHSQYTLAPKPGTLDWVRKAAAHGELLATEYWPTLIRPKPWTKPWGGGYHTPLLPRLPLVKTRGHAGSRAYLEDLGNQDMGRVYDAVNAVQNTAWAVNKPVLDVFKEVVEREMHVAGLPPMTDLPMPPRPGDIDTNESAKKWWKKAASMVHGKNNRNRSKRIQVRRTLFMAEKFAAYSEFFFPHQMDFRGRLYAIPTFLNPQGPDCTKGLLTFAHGKPVETEEQLEWLAVHGANTYGVDKVSYADRWNWVYENQDAIIRAADYPLTHGWEFWTGADSPFQFLAWCFEWVKVMRGGWGTVSSLPVALDGSCNGLQHYSAALRDPVGGAAVNLTPSEAPQDIYGVVAGRVVDKLRTLKDISGPDGDLARKWLEFGVDRKITKRSVMTLPYGCSLFSVREFVEEAMREKLDGGKGNPFAFLNEKGDRRDGVFESSKFLQGLVWDAIGKTVVAARNGMDWLQAVAKACAADELPITWTTPDGFVVQQAYVSQELYFVKTKLDGKIVQMKLADDSHVMDRRRQRNGIAPNWVHSMDATALRVFVNIAAEQGVDAFCLVHDSYGAVAADVPVVAAALREAFILLYDERDALGSFYREVTRSLDEGLKKDIPAVPPTGTLDLGAIRESLYFFA